MQYEEEGNELQSIWDYDPPGDVASTGAWRVLRELATTLSRCYCCCCPGAASPLAHAAQPAHHAVHVCVRLLQL